MTEPQQPLTRRAALEAEAGAVGRAGPPVTAVRRDQIAAVSGAPGADGAAREPRGFTSVFSRYPRAWLFSTLAVVFLLLGTGSVFAGVDFGSSRASAVVAPTLTPTPTVDPPRPVPATVAAATHLRTCSVVALAADPRLMTFEGSVINADTGEVLFDRAAAKPAPTASVLKTLTAAAALATLGPDHQLTTRVYEGSTPGSIVLVGGGDPTISAVPPGQESFYTGAPKYSDLAAQTLATWKTLQPDQPITSVVLDSTMWDPADNWDPSWERIEQTEGSQPEITALMVDGDRANPSRGTSPRSTDPIGAAGKAFVAALGLDLAGVQVSQGSVQPNAKPLAEVKSQPVRALIGQMLPMSDNTLGEMLARVISVSVGKGGSSASLAQVIPAALAAYKLDTTGIVIKDGSGLSANDAVPPAFVAALMAKVLAGQQNLNLIYNALPVAGKAGTLANRFTGPSAIARGQVNAKTGYIKSARTLAGIVHAKDGTNLAFAFYALGPVRSDAMTALDALTAGVFSCGNNLSNN